MQEQELDVAAGHETGHIVVEELVDAFKVPGFGEHGVLINR